MVFKTMMAYGFSYFNEQTLHVYGDEGTMSLDIRDAWGKKYYRVDGEALQVFTRRGIPIFPPNSYTHTVDLRPPTPTVGPKDSHYHAPTPRYAGTLVPTYDKLYGVQIQDLENLLGYQDPKSLCMRIRQNPREVK